MAKDKGKPPNRGKLMRQIAALYAEIARDRECAGGAHRVRRKELERRIAELERKLVES